MLELKNVSLKIDSFLLDNIRLLVQDNQCHIICGPTGSGKTLLLESIVGFRRPQRGEILLDGRDIQDLPVEKRGISYLPQDLAIFPHLNVKENIFFSLKIRKIEDKEHNDLVYDLIDAVGIKHLLHRSVENLSGGERQRVALVRALASGYKLLLLDEPFSALHEAMQRELWFLIKKLQKRYRLTIIMVTHDLEEAFFLGDVISILINGRIHQTGPKKDVYHQPKTVETARFLGIKNLFNAEVTDIKNGTLSIYCNDLNTQLDVHTNSNLNFKKGAKLIAGIRAEEVMILRPDLLRENQDNLLKGVILESFEKGATYTIMFMSEKSSNLLEIEIPNYAFRKLNISAGKEVTTSIRRENIFLISLKTDS
ncbi:MAG TPA: ABC transporter ATP-binding protein [Candidatus Hypogeohydataceae bacterium YC41]